MKEAMLIAGAVVIALIVAAVLYYARNRASESAAALTGAAVRTIASASGTSSQPFGTKTDAPGDAARRAEIEAAL